MKNVTNYKTRDQRWFCEPEKVITTIFSHFDVKMENNSYVNCQEPRRNVTVL
jgi:hypothetical protein